MRSLLLLVVAAICMGIGYFAGNAVHSSKSNAETAAASRTIEGGNMKLTSESALALRNGGIDATAALNEALKEVLTHLPPEAHSDAKLAIGRAIAAVLDETVNPAVQAFPQLSPDQATWVSVAKASAARRSAE
jgi:hypothetical protein